MYKLIAMLVPVLFLVGAGLFDYYKKNIGCEMEIYPPTDKSASLFEKCAGKKITSRGIAAAIIELCSAGVLKLNLVGDKLDILLINEYRGHDEIKKTILDYMFKDNNEVEGLDNGIIAYPVYHLTEKSISADVTKDLLKRLNELNVSRKGYKNVSAGRKSIILAAAAFQISVTIIFMIMGQMEGIIVSVLIGFFIMMGFKIFDDSMSKYSVSNIIFSVFWMVFVFFWICGFFKDNISLFVLVEAYVAAFIYLYVNLWKKEDISRERDRQLYNGFIKLLNKSKKNSEINANYSLANPKRIYEVLPYVCAVGKHKQWIEQHRNIPYETPEWIASDKEYDYDVLEECVDKLVAATKSS